jgi:hypothetical protein
MSAGAATGVAAAQQAQLTFQLPNGFLKEQADALLGVMSFQLTPDITTASLSINKKASGNPSLAMFNLGSGFTLSESFPLYLEGTLSAARYDPVFIASNGAESRSFPLKWDSAAITAGIGWNFRLADDLVLRPIVNVSLGYLASDLKLLQLVVNEVYDIDIQWINGQDMKAFGYGGSLVLDYERYRPETEIDIELRYTYIKLKSFDTIAPVKGEAEASNINLWARLRAPLTDLAVFDNPLRYVLELTHTEYLGEQRGALGFESLTALGAGLEVEPGFLIDRVRLVGRYVFGNNISGFSVGITASF